ncbi:MAG TPA: amidohydrolase family protein [Pyrinomonadaceae bacterium]|nr:amidohydrolase family protein [Pyrinomonadaceae bacterium]
MRNAVLLFTGLAVLLATFSAHAQVQTSVSHNYEFTNGNWFDGQKFVRRTFYTVGNRLTTKRPARIDRVFDLSGKYVVPPFGEAHNHNLDWSSDERFARVNKMYLDAGIFYVKNPNSLLRSKEPTSARINLPTTVDGILSNGGLTGSGGHPIEIVSPQRGFKPGDGEGGFYYVIDTAADLEKKWPIISSGKPDFIKTYLLYSEEYAKRKDDKAYDGWKGLDPAVLPEIVRKAHREGLRVSTHVESAADFHHAVAAGVDEINHLPGFRPDRNDVSNYANLARYQISEADAKLAGQKQIVVVTTIGETAEQTFNEKLPEQARLAVRSLLVQNLHLLHKHRVPIAIGSDSFRQTALVEALSLARIEAFDNLTLLKMWCETTATAIFPRRKIGQLKDGYEANFLVLTGNPLADFANVKTIELRVKQGEPLQ